MNVCILFSVRWFAEFLYIYLHVKLRTRRVEVCVAKSQMYLNNLGIQMTLSVHLCFFN
ncbi:hypothetical protein ACE6H2_012245 [Prunus campanulata]